GTVVRAGTLQAAADGSLGPIAAPVTVEPAGTLTFGSTTTVRSYTLLGGSLTVAAGRTFTGTNLNYTASAQVNVNGTANVQNLTSVGRITIANGGTLTQLNPNTAFPLTLGGGSVTVVNSGGTLSWGGSGTTQLGRLAGGLLVNNGTVTGGRLVVDYGGLA